MTLEMIIKELNDIQQRAADLGSNIERLLIENGKNYHINIIEEEAKASMKRTPTIYIAGPMRGHDDGNFPSFDRQEKVLLDQGWITISPANMDRKDGEPPGGHLEFDPATDYKDREFMRDALKRDLVIICEEATAIYMMHGWENSRGSKAEWHTAKALGLDIYYEVPLPEYFS